jgi:hypothetical membrane protein
MRALALGGAAGPALFVVTTALCGALLPGYDHATEFISALGARGAGTAPLMNLAGFIPSGLLLVGFAAALRAVLPRRPLAFTVALLVGLFGAGITVAGLFSCDPGCPQPAVSSEGRVHDGVSGFAFLSGLAAVSLSAILFRRTLELRSLWFYSALSAVVAVVLLVVFARSIESGGPAGLWQRLFLATLFGWCVVVGLRVFRLGTLKGP